MRHFAAGFRPLSGKWGYRSDGRYTIAARRDDCVSVPSRGNGVIDHEALPLILHLHPGWFPSPLGEMGLSISATAAAEEVRLGLFPSPLGEMGLSIIIRAVLGVVRNACGFPSPLGEMGLSIV